MNAVTGVPGDVGDVSAGARATAARWLAVVGGRTASLDRLCELAASLIGVRSAQVSLVSDVQVVVGAAGACQLAEHEDTAEGSLSALTTELGSPLEAGDVYCDERLRALPLVAAGQVRSFLGVPLISSGGQVVGALAAYDEMPHAWSPGETATLERLAAAVVAELELAALRADFESGQVAWRLATDAAGVGAFDWHLATDELRWDDRLLELFGLDRKSFGGSIEAFNAFVHPEDLPRVTTALQVAIDTCGEFSTEYRIELPDGRLRWIAARGRVMRGPNGTAARLLGAAYDSTAVQEGEARVARVLESMPTAFFQLDLEWRFSYLNSHAERILGATRDDLVGQVVWDAFPAAVESEFERGYRGAAETGEPVAFDAYYPDPLDAWYEVRAWPNPDGLAVYFVDITARYRAQEQMTRSARRSALVARATEQLSGTLDVGEAVARLGALLVPDLGDWCVATLVQDPGREGRMPALRDVGGWHRDPAAQALVDRFAEVRLSHLSDDSFLPAVLASDKPIVATDATSALIAVFEEGETCDLISELAPEYSVVVSLRGHDRVVGLLTVLRSVERGPFTQDAVDNLAEVADRAGLALGNARLFAEQRDLAEGLQRSMLTRPPQPDHLQIVVRYEAAAETARVGGDWYDAFVQAEGSTVLVIGDVMGHDTAAAAAMGQVRSLLRGVAVFSGEGPADVLRGVDRALETLQVDTTATAVVARLEQTSEEVEQGVTRLRWSNAGHPPPVILTTDGTVQVLEAPEPNLLLGLDSAADRTEQEVIVDRGSTVLIFTDGLVERRGEDLETGLERLRRELSHLGEGNPPVDELCDRLLAQMVPGRREDDVALVAVRMHPQEGPPPAEAGGSSVPALVHPDAVSATTRTVMARFLADPESIPEVRQFARRAVASRNPALVEDVALCVTELATNAALHGEGHFIEVSVLLDSAAVTIAVANEGRARTETVVPRMVVAHEGDAAGELADQATTGRGLGIVSALAHSWGVETTFEGIRVWARLVDEELPAP